MRDSRTLPGGRGGWIAKGRAETQGREGKSREELEEK